MRRWLFGGLLLLAAGPALADDPAAKPDPIETALAQEWQGLQLSQQHFGEAAGKLLEAYRKERARADADEAKLKEPPK